MSARPTFSEACGAAVSHFQVTHVGVRCVYSGRLPKNRYVFYV